MKKKIQYFPIDEKNDVILQYIIKIGTLQPHT